MLVAQLGRSLGPQPTHDAVQLGLDVSEPRRLLQLAVLDGAIPRLATAVRVGERIRHMQHAADEVLALNVRAAQPARTAAGVKGPPAVHDAHVVEEHALARRHLDLVHGGLVVDQAVEQPRGFQPGAHVDGRQLEAVLERRAPVHAGEDVVGRRHVEERALLAVPVAALLVVVRDAHAAQVLDGAARILQPHELAGAQPVAEERLAAGARVLHAVQDLDRRRPLQVQQVLVQAEVAAGVGDVLGVGLGAHVERAAVEGLLDVGDARRDVDDGVFVARHVLEEHEAQAGQVEDGLPEGLVALHELAVVNLADVPLDRLVVPERPPRLRIHGVLPRVRQLLHVLVAQGLLDRLPRDHHFVAALGEALDVVPERDPEAIFGQPDLVNLDVGWDVGRRKVLLARRGIRTLHAGAAVAQGGRVEPGPPAMLLILNLDKAVGTRHSNGLATVD